MRKIPTLSELSSRQDVYHVCDMMDPVRALLWLKNMPDADRSRLGVSATDIRSLRAAIGVKKRKLVVEDTQKRRRMAEILKTKDRIDKLTAGIETERRTNREDTITAGRMMIVEEELKRLQRALVGLRSGDVHRPVEAIRADIAEHERLHKAAQHAANELLGLVSSMKALQKERAEIMEIMAILKAMRPIDAVDADIEHLAEAMSAASCGEAALDGLTAALQKFGAELSASVDADRQTKDMARIKAEIAAREAELKACRDAREAVKAHSRTLAALESELTSARQHLKTIEASED